jgi:hypothetical protein
VIGNQPRNKLRGFLLALNMHKMKIKCRTAFDCTCTGVTGHYRASQIPFVDRSGQPVNNQQDWQRSRNQQRNYETLLQIFGLKTQPQDLTTPEKINNNWEFEFAVDAIEVYALTSHSDPLAGLRQDCQGVPMIDCVTDITQLMSRLEPDQNIWFDVLNTATEN